jgi:hypothetical protein
MLNLNLIDNVDKIKKNWDKEIKILDSKKSKVVKFEIPCDCICLNCRLKILKGEIILANKNGNGRYFWEKIVQFDFKCSNCFNQIIIWRDYQKKEFKFIKGIKTNFIQNKNDKNKKNKIEENKNKKSKLDESIENLLKFKTERTYKFFDLNLQMRKNLKKQKQNILQFYKNSNSKKEKN